MNSITLDISSDDAVHHGISLLQRLAGAAGNAIASVAPGGRTAKTGDARGWTAAEANPAAASAAAQSQASTAATGDAGNATSAGNADPAPLAAQAAAASTALAPAGEPTTSFDELKKAFLGLSTKPGGRELCIAALKPFNLAKLSEAKPDQYRGLLSAINKAAA
jgi:hypothetical protein